MIAQHRQGRTGDTARATAPSTRLRAGGPRLAITTAVVVAVLSTLAPALVGASGPEEALWWPAAGAALALAVRRPARRWWCVAGTLVGTVAASHLLDLDRTGTAVFASAQALQCGVGAAVVSALGRGEPARLRRGRDAWRLTAGTVAGVAAAALLVQTATPGAAVTYALGQLLGILLLAPLLLVPRARRAGDRRSRAAVTEWALVLAVSVGVSAAVFWNDSPGPWSFLVVVPALWGAARLGVGRALSGQLAVAVVATTGTAAQLGPYGGLGLPGSLALQALLFTSGAVALVMSLVVRSRERAVVIAGKREEVFRRTFDDALLGVALLRLRPDGSAVVARVNERLQSMLGTDVAVGSDWSEQVHPDHRDVFVEAVAEMALEVGEGRQAHWHAELRHGDGQVWLELAAAAWPTPGDDGRPGEVGAVVQVADVTQRRLVQRRLREAALHDPLTGLPNRTLLEDRLRHALSAAARSGDRVALLYCDLDDFKPVNDTGGHAAGDHVLIDVAARLTAAVRPGDTVARLGGDEFAVVCPDLPDEAAARVVAERVVAAMGAPFPVAGWEFRVGISVGLAMADAHQDATRVLQQADQAMYEAKGSGKGRVRSAGSRTIDLRTARA
ncbi:diguanylate cyclase domain-containing protein [Kineococcus aurantiacus]|uniref:Diguanylate cyclase (GGDEF)-like protein n=1 Tax=Kineococcus aurantiacus TaxID=37633 RepID=A0A7Y9J1C2_9ACTN|nr:diguanylate cyclase [Kineococcus aurantiacus]NYD22928.1 diguanylate cyclase (GGDEF)-like protein [Kineococcus aurantiacus]